MKPLHIVLSISDVHFCLKKHASETLFCPSHIGEVLQFKFNLNLIFNLILTLIFV